MNSPECTQLEDFLDQLERIHEIEKLAKARAMFERAVAQQLDATYVLVQRGLPLGRAVNRAKARVGASDRAEQARGAGFALGEAADNPALEVDSAAGHPLFI